MQYILWAISFVSLWLTIIWLSLVFFKTPGHVSPRRAPEVTITVPVLNGGARILRTLNSIKNLDYPASHLHTVVVDDGSTDDTTSIVTAFINDNPGMCITLVRHPNNLGKGAALNTALASAKGEFFSCMDADSRTEPDALWKLLRVFERPAVAAVIPTVKVDEPKNAYEYAQRVEYIFGNLLRHVLSKMDTLFLTHGVMSVFRTSALKEVGGFDPDKRNITEDLEIALRLRKNHYITTMAYDAIGYTRVPSTFRAIWRQRIRWFRGFIYNHTKFRELIGNPDYGLFGMFQLPLNVVGIGLLLTTILLVTYGGLKDALEFVIRSITIPGYFWNHVMDFPTLKEFLLGQNVQIVLPIILGTVLGIWLIIIAHRRLHERVLRYIGHIWCYFMIAPYITSVHWMTSITHEVFRTKRKW